MGKIYVGQTSLRIHATCDVDITGATSTKIKYIKPDKTTGELEATVEDAALGTIYYDLTTPGDDEFLTAGSWTFWAYIVFADGRDADGEPHKEKIYVPGK